MGQEKRNLQNVEMLKTYTSQQFQSGTQWFELHSTRTIHNIHWFSQEKGDRQKSNRQLDIHIKPAPWVRVDARSHQARIDTRQQPWEYAHNRRDILGGCGTWIFFHCHKAKRINLPCTDSSDPTNNWKRSTATSRWQQFHCFLTLWNLLQNSPIIFRSELLYFFLAITWIELFL